MTAARPERTLALAAGGLLAVVFVIWAAFGVAGWTIGTASRSEHRVIAGPVRALRIDGAGRNDVAVEEGPGPDVTVDSVAAGSFRAPHVRVETTATSIHISGGCRPFWFGHCRVSLTVHVPPGTPVDVNASSGDISASGLSGPVRLATSSGDVSATGVRSRTVDAHAGSGNVDLGFAAAPRSVDAETGSGDVSVLVPRGGVYAVDAETSSGDRTVGVRSDARAAAVVRARAGSGDISVLYGG